jgi:hypothetical protein
MKNSNEKVIQRFSNEQIINRVRGFFDSRGYKITVLKISDCLELQKLLNEIIPEDFLDHN